MKKVPFYFYIDTRETKSSEQGLLLDFKYWLAKVTDKNRNEYENESLFMTTSHFMGFVENKGAESNPNGHYYGAKQSDNEEVFTNDSSVKITLDYWSNNIRNKKYTVVACVSDNWGDYDENVGGFDGDNITLKKVYRYDAYMMPSRAMEMTKALRAADLISDQPRGGYMICKEATYYASGYGYYPVYCKTARFSSNRHPLFDVKNKIIRDLENLNKSWIKCEFSGRYLCSDEANIEDVLLENGTTVQIPINYIGDYTSSLHGIIFSCANSAVRNGFVLCDELRDWVKPGEEREVPNARYHALSREFLCDRDSKFTIGLEIEKEDEDVKNNIGYKKLFDRTKWCKERDGSLNEHGYELISPVYDLFSSNMDKDIEKDEDMKALINANYSHRCGGHINIGSSIYSPIQLLFGIKGFLPLLYSIWSMRVDNHYSEVRKPHEYGNSKRAIKIKDNVIEIRLASAVKSVKNMIWRRDLMRIIMKNINSSEQEVLRMMLNPRSILHKHLRKVYSSDRFMDKCNKFVKYADSYNDIKLNEPNWDALELIKSEVLASTEED